MKTPAWRSGLALVVATTALLLAACGDAGGDDPTAVDGSGEQATDRTGAEAGGDVTTESETGSATGDDGAPGTGVDAAIAGGDDDGADGPSVDEGAGRAAAAPAVDVESLTGVGLEEFLARRYEDFWLAFGEARERPTATPALDFPALADLAAGEQLESAYAELTDMAETGRALRTPTERAVPEIDHERSHRIRIDAVDGGSAQLVACHVNDRESYQVADGAVISDLVVTVEAEATMVLTDGTWKLVRSRAVALDPGVAGCWLEEESLYPW